jgi:hypothetical protein
VSAGACRILGIKIRTDSSALPTIRIGLFVTALIDVDLPRYDHAEVVVSAPEAGPGNWAGGASCVAVNGIFWLAYSIRRSLNSSRGVGVVVAKSLDGVNFKPVCEVSREGFRCC